MRTVVFVAPFFLDTTVRFLAAAAAHPGARLVLVSQDPPARLAAEVRERLAAHVQVADALDAQEIADAVRQVARRTGGVHRLLGTLEHLQVPLAEVRDALDIPGMRTAVAQNFRDKARMKEVLRRAGVPCARHRLATSADAARAFVREVGYPVVAKPPAGAGAKGTYQAEDDASLAEVLATTRPSAARPLLVEEFVRGEEHSFDGVSIDGRLVWSSLTHYLPTPLDAVRNPWIQWCVLLPREVDHPRYEPARQAAAKALGALGMETGVSHMEWFRRADGSVAVSEVGARPGGAQISKLISYAHDFDFYRAWARLAIDGTFDAPRRAYAAGAAFLRGQGVGRVQLVRGLEKAQAEVGPLVVEAQIPRAGQTPSSSYEGDGFVIVRHRETAVVERALERLITTIRVELG